MANCLVVDESPGICGALLPTQVGKAADLLIRLTASNFRTVLIIATYMM